MNFGRYQIVRELGKGSMGVVYQAHDPNLDLKVALKVLRQDRLGTEAFVKRFRGEPKALGRLDHPNIVRVYNVDEDQGTIYIAMEFIEGETLEQILGRKRFTPAEIVDLGVTLSETLDYAHGKGIVHRDVKPSNILLRPDGRVKITDFGIAHFEDPRSSLQTIQAGEILGTPAYMSPEQVLSRPVDGRSDLFSVGVILYEMSTGKRPFQGENLASLFDAITHDNPIHPSKINPAIPVLLSNAIMKCLGKDPSKRFESGRVLAQTLKKSLPDKVIVDRDETKRKRILKRRVLWIAMMIVLAGTIGGFSYHFFYPKGEKSSFIEQITTGFLKVESSPHGAEIFVDGVLMGKTPLRFGLSIGKHEVHLALPAYYDWEAQIDLKEGEMPLSVSLNPIEGKKP